MTSHRVAVVLYGCDPRVGVETHESVLTLLAVAKQGVRLRCFVPDSGRTSVVDHHPEPTAPGESDGRLISPERLAQGVTPLSELQLEDYDAVVFPAGFGAVSSLSAIGVPGADLPVDPEMGECVRNTFAVGKPLGAMCIPPALLARVLGQEVSLAAGNNANTVAALQAAGVAMEPDDLAGIMVDPERRVVTTPCYTCDATIERIGDDIGKVARTLVGLLGPVPKQPDEAPAEEQVEAPASEQAEA